MILLSILYSLVLILVMVAIWIYMQTRIFQKTAVKQNEILQENLAFNLKKHENNTQKYTFLESYNKELLKKLFGITQDLLLVKKAILEDAINGFL